MHIVETGLRMPLNFAPMTCGICIQYLSSRVCMVDPLNDNIGKIWGYESFGVARLDIHTEGPMSAA